MKILVAVPHNYIAFDINFTMSLLGMQNNFFEWVIKNKRNDTLSIVRQSGYQIDEMRNSLVEVALKHKMTHILFLDTDMSFREEMIVEMIKDIEDNEDMNIEAITGLYVRKTPPYLPHIYPEFLKTNKFGIAGIYPTEGLSEVAGAGMGCCMIDMKVFKRTKKPYFKMGGNIRGAKGLGEDLYFCAKAKPKMLCDTRLKCSHFKQVGITPDYYLKSNGLKVVDGQVQATKKQIEKIAKKYDLTKK